MEQDGEVLIRLRARRLEDGLPVPLQIQVLEIDWLDSSKMGANGPNTIIGLLPDGKMITCCDSKKLRPVVVGGNSEMVAIASEVCGLNAIMPDRDISKDIYPNEREMVVIDNDLAVQRWNQ